MQKGSAGRFPFLPCREEEPERDRQREKERMHDMFELPWQMHRRFTGD